jgi:hypothetical protein
MRAGLEERGVATRETFIIRVTFRDGHEEFFGQYRTQEKASAAQLVVVRNVPGVLKSDILPMRWKRVHP